MNITKTDWYLILLAFVVFALVGINEWGYGAIALLPLLLLAYWLITRAFETEKPDE
jgi:hypothetical protein